MVLLTVNRAQEHRTCPYAEMDLSVLNSYSHTSPIRPYDIATGVMADHYGHDGPLIRLFPPHHMAPLLTPRRPQGYAGLSGHGP